MKPSRRSRTRPAEPASGPSRWLRRIKLRALGALLCAVLLVFTLTAFSLPMWPVIGVTVAAVAVTMHKMTHRLAGQACLSCGKDLTGEPIGLHGVICPECGAVAHPSPGHLARLERAFKHRTPEIEPAADEDERSA
ncbi:MAG: hypothetical protein KF768_00790 [Phycisphaeraceae bacterium]|nr:hypothetical protein [Phycisphaeraceae bacterium]